MPVISSLQISGDAVYPEENKAIAGYPFNVVATASDEGGGIAQTTLRRDGEIVAIAYNSTSLHYQHLDAAVGSYAYTLDVADRAGNTASSTLVVAVAQDQPPVISNLIVPDTIREQSEFSIKLSSSDDVGLSQLDVEWNGFTDTYELGGVSAINAKSYSVVDKRAERLSDPLTLPLTARLQDGRGQDSTLQKSITVIPDLAPDASLLGVNMPQNAFYGSSVSIHLSDVDKVDDAPSGLQLQLVQFNGDNQQILKTFTQGSVSQTSFVYNFVMPVDELPQDEFTFKVVATDALGQSSETLFKTIHLTQPPNLIRFESATVEENPAVIKVEDEAIYRVQVLDASSRPVPNQTIKWYLRDLATGATTYRNSNTTDDGGFATHAFTAAHKTGSYQLRAELPAFPLVDSAVYAITVKHGPTRKIVASIPDAVVAGAPFTLELQALDSQFNVVTDDDITGYQLTLPAGFSTIPADGITITTSTIDGESREVVTGQLGAGVSAFSANAATMAADLHRSNAVAGRHSALL